MLRALRWKFTIAFLGATLALIVLTGAGAYFELQRYFQNSIDLSLQHRMAGQLQLFGFPLPPELVQAEETWTQQEAQTSSSGVPTANPLPVQSDDSEGSEFQHEQRELLRADYSSDLILIFVMPLDDQGNLLFNPNPFSPLMQPDTDAAKAALAAGSDLRTVRLDSGKRVRLLTYRTAAGGQPALLQVGRSLAASDQALNQLALGALGVGALIMLVVGAGSWSLAGRTLLPAQHAWDQQQSFVANASHELRTPLTLMRASTEMALRGRVTGKEADLLRDVLRESDHMDRLVGDLLLLSRLDAGRMKLEKENFSVNALLEEIEHLALKMPNGDRVQIQKPELDTQLQADRARLRQVLLIFIDNALKHTNGEIRVLTEVTASRIGFEVSDDGPGIPPEHLPHIFERFYQVQAGSDDEARTSGLGLSIAKALIELHGGMIRVESEPASGSRFTISIPITQ